MTESRLIPTRLQGWKRVALPATVASLFGTPMLWGLGVFDGTADPLRHAAIFGASAILLSCLTPWCIGWALQGFVLRQKAEHEPAHGEPPHATHPRPGAPAHAGRHG